jgi:hypothetical protein
MLRMRVAVDQLMRHFLQAVSFTVAVAAFLGSQMPAWAAAQTGAPRIVVDADRFDFGEVKEGARLTHTFHICNQGSARLNFKAAYADCVCTVSKLKKRYLAPEQTTDLVVTVDTTHKNGVSTSHVLVYSNDPQVPMLRVDVTMDVLADPQ